MSSAEDINRHPLDAISTALTASRGEKREREGGQIREHLARSDDVIHRNRKQARRGGNKRKSDASERHRLIIIEQRNFRECEINFLPLIRRWENAIRNKNSDQLLGIYQYLLYKIESFTAPFIEEYDVENLISESRHLVADRDVVKQVGDKFSRANNNTKKRRIPEGFKARKQRNEEFNKRTIGNECFHPKKRHVSEDFKARKERNEDFNQKTPGKEYVDIFVANGKVIKSCGKKLQIILLRAIKSGRPTPYREQFLNAKTSIQQLEIANSVWGVIRNIEYHPVRFLHKENSDEWVELGPAKINQLIAVALSGAVQLIQPTDNDIILGLAYIYSEKRDRDKVRRAIDQVLHLGKPTNREHFRKAMERGDIKLQLGIAERMSKDIRNISDPPVRFLRQIPKTDNWKEVKAPAVLCNDIRLKLMETQPSGNDVLQLGLYCSRDDTSFLHFHECEGNMKLQRLLHTEGFFELYRTAWLKDNKNRVEQIIEVQKKVLECVQQLTPPMRFLFQISQTGTWLELGGYNRLLRINDILWNADSNQSEKEDFLRYKKTSFEDTEKLRNIVYRTGKIDYSLRKFRQADSLHKKHEVAEELLFIIRTLNPCLKFVHSNNRTRVRDKIIVTHLLPILQNTKADDSQIDDMTSQSARVASNVRDLPLQPINNVSLSECNNDLDELLSNTETYFMLDDTIDIDIEPEAEAGSDVVREKISYERLSLAHEQMKIKEEPEEEHIAPIYDQSSNFPADEDSRKIKQEVEREPNQEVECEDENEEADNVPQIETKEIDTTDDASTTEAATQKVKKERHTGDDNPPGIKTIDVDMSDVSIGGDVESTNLSKTETSTITGRKATAIRIVRGRSLEVTLPPSVIRQCMNGVDVLRSAATQCVLDRSHVFIFSDNIKKAIYDEKKVVRYEFRGQNPTSAQFKSLPIDDILRGDEDTVLIKMSVNDVEGEGDVTLEDSLF